MKKYLYLKINKQAVFFKNIKNINIQNYYILKEKNILFRIFRKFNMINSILFGMWKFQIKKCDYIILGENGYLPIISKYIKNKNPSCKVIMYYWNILNDEYKKILEDKNIDEFWTFDKNDSQRYNLKYNPQFYSKDIILNNNEIEQGVTFLGRAKERKNELIKLEKTLNTLGIATNFYIIEKEKDLIGYDKYLESISESKCILDYNQEGQVGLTLRPMEALFLKKKLITNNKDIVNYNFYKTNNIFILGIDDMSKIRAFIDSPYEEVDEEIVNYYDFESWLKRFGI